MTTKTPVFQLVKGEKFIHWASDKSIYPYLKKVCKTQNRKYKIIKGYFFISYKK